MTTTGNLVSTLWRLKAVSVALACVFAAGQAQANGTDPAVVAGQASFSTQGGALSITNSPGAIINWQGFSIGAGETTHFIQQNAASSVLNRVIGPDPSVILGTLTSNGRVFLINPSGILVGQGAHIDVAGLVASTLNLSNQDFLAGRLNFASNPLAGTVENQGTITTPSGGSVYLVGANITNSGIINSPQGDVILAAGRSVNILDTSTPGVRVEITANDNASVNLGEILAQSGQIGIYGAALRNTGIINADQVVRETSGKIVLRAKQDITLEAGSHLSASGEQGGEITVQSETGTTLVSGTIDAKGTTGKGGSVQLLGNRVGLTAASVDASGTTGGGTVLVGGDYQGKNPIVQNASATYVSPDSSISADAITSGNGGKVILWADSINRYYGHISARGGVNSGNGGFVEVSGKHYLDFLGIVNTLAPAGKAGTLLLDPSDITISAGGNAGMTAPGTTSPFTGALATSTLNETTLTNALGSGNVLVDASAGAAAGAGNITVSTAITWVAATTLELRAKNDVIVDAAMTGNTAGAAIKLTAGHDVTVNQPLSANGAPAAITLSAGHDVLVKAALSANGAGSVVELRADNLGTGTGTVTFSGAGNVSGSTPTTNIYYNPTSYANYAADYAAYRALVPLPGTLNTYMLLYVTGLSADKTYNGNLTAGLTGTATITPAAGDTVNLAGSGSITNFSNKDVHTEVLTLSGYSISGAQSSHYSLFQPASLSATITTKALTQSGLSVAASRVYDATTGTTLIGASALLAAEAPGTGTTADGKAYTGDTVNLTGTSVGTYNSKDVATASTVTFSGLTLGGAQAGNYSLTPHATQAATITAKALTQSGLSVAASRVYDATTGTTLIGASALLAAEAPGTGTTADGKAYTGDTVNLTGTSVGTYNSKDVATAATVTFSGLTLGGAQAGNYSLTPHATQAATIAAKALTQSGLSVAASRVYDATTGTTLIGASALLAAEAPGTGTTADGKAYTGDTVNLTGTSVGTYNSKDVATASTVTFSGLTLGGAQAGNYSLTPHATQAATITPRALTIVADALNKVYGATDPALTYVANGFQLGDSAGTVLSGALSRATGENVGNYAIGKNTLASNANYTVAYTGNNLGITPAPLNVAANSQSKLFGASDPALTFSVTGLVNNPALGIADTAGTVLSGALTRAPGESALGGPYAITQGSLAANSNYSLGFTPNNLIIIGAAAEPVLGFNADQVVFAGVINNEFYYRPGNFWHISLNPNDADPGFDVMRGTSDSGSRLSRSLNSCDSVSGGGFCETWSFPQQREKGDKK